MQALEDILGSTGKMLQSQIPTATIPCILGQYYSSSSWDQGYEERKDCSNGGLNGVSGRGAPVTVTKGKNRNTRGHVNGFKLGPAVWATAVAWKVEGDGFVPRLSYVSVKGVQYSADTHVSGTSSTVKYSSQIKEAGCRVQFFIYPFPSTSLGF